LCGWSNIPFIVLRVTVQSPLPVAMCAGWHVRAGADGPTGLASHLYLTCHHVRRIARACRYRTSSTSPTGKWRTSSQVTARMCASAGSATTSRNPCISAAFPTPTAGAARCVTPPSFSCSPFLLLLPLSSPHPRDLRGTPASFAALPLLALGSLAFFPSRSLFPLPCSQSLVPCSQSLGPYGSCRNPQIRRVYTAMRLPQSFAFYRVTVCRVPHPGRWSRNAP